MGHDFNHGPATDTLIAKKLIFRTKKRRGNTSQVEVFRMPKSCWGSGLKSDASKSPQSVGKASHKRRTSGLICDTNPDTDNLKPISNDNTLGVASTTGVQPNGEVSDFLVEKYQYQKPNGIARDHVKWPEFAAWCRTKRDKHGQPGVPTEEGFWKWQCGQKPQWRNKVKSWVEEDGYELHGKFYPTHQANQLALSDPNVVLKFREATRRNGRVVLKPSIK